MHMCRNANLLRPKYLKGYPNVWRWAINVQTVWANELSSCTSVYKICGRGPFSIFLKVQNGCTSRPTAGDRRRELRPVVGFL